MISTFRASYQSPLSILFGKEHFQAMSGGQEPTKPQSAVDAWTTNLAKIVPAETFAAYASFRAFAPETDETRIVPIFCVIIAMAIRALTTAKTDTRRPDVLAMLIAGAVTIAWIYAQGDWFLDLQGTPLVRKIAGLSLGSISAILPFVLSRK